MSINSIKHKNQKRALIPSIEEEGYEQSNPVVKDKPKVIFDKDPVINRGQDPHLVWLDKYGKDNSEQSLEVDIRSLYRSEHISPEMLIKNLYSFKDANPDQFNIFETFNNYKEINESEKPYSYYKQADDWRNRMVLGDSILVMSSLLEREGLAGKVQMIYIDPPYGIKYGSNWQMKLNNRNVKDGDDENVTGEPEQIKAYRDTWEKGIHSYLSYLRDRLLVAKELLNESGSCFVQISDENVHLVRCIMDEVFGSENFVSLISYASTIGFGTNELSRMGDYILWFAKEKTQLKFRSLFVYKEYGGIGTSGYNRIELEGGERMTINEWEKRSGNKLNSKTMPSNSKLYNAGDISFQGETNSDREYFFKGKKYFVKKGRHYPNNMRRLEKLGRIESTENNLAFVRYFDDFPVTQITNLWFDTLGQSQYGDDGKIFVVQTSLKVVQRCLLMTTDPGDLVLDPTCGSGTTAFVAEQWGRRWITIDTSRIALNIAKTRLTTASFPFYKLYDEFGEDIRKGFLYKKVPHVTLKSLANDEQPEEETLFDQPYIDNKKLRVSGPFTVETLQHLDPISPSDLEKIYDPEDKFIENIYEHLKAAGIKNGIKNEQAVFTRIDTLTSHNLHAEGYYSSTKQGNGNGAKERKAYIHIGPKFGTVSKTAVSDAIKDCRNKRDADWLIILGFSFESDISNQSVTTSFGTFEVTKVRMHDDLLQQGLLKRDKKAASFVTIGEPDIKVHQLKTNSKKEAKSNLIQIEICGLDIYDPIKDEVKSRDINDIAYWMIDDNYDSSNFIVNQIFFCGGDKDEFDKWQKGLESLAISKTKKNLEKTLKIEIDYDAFERLYSHKSHPILITKKDQKIAVKVISQFGEESLKIVTA